MAAVSNPREVTREIRHVRQARLYKPDPVPGDVLDELLEIARWTGSSRNTQPWEFIVVTDPEQLRKISQVRTPINWVADAPLAIAIVLNGESPLSEAFDEGRVTERLLIGARLLGLGGGTAWFGDDAQQAEGKKILGIPAERTARSVVVLGYPTTTKDHRPNPADAGRRPLADLVSYERLGKDEGSS
jgi:nitroreductase